MPIYDFECRVCGRFLEDVVQSIREPPPTCSGETVVEKEGNFETVADTHDPTLMTTVPGRTSFRLGGKGWPDKDRQERRERFQRRNARIEKMTPEQQQGIKDIIDSTGGDRYIP